MGEMHAAITLHLIIANVQWIHSAIRIFET